MQGAIISHGDNKIYKSNGTLTAKDKRLFMLEPISEALKGSQVIFDGDGTAKIHCNFETEELQEKYSKIRREVRDNYNKGNKDPEYFEFGT